MLLDDCVVDCTTYPTGSRKLWRVGASGFVARLRGLSGHPKLAPVIWSSFSPAGDVVVYADQKRYVRIAPVDLGRMVLTSTGTKLTAIPR
ncbi:MAG TPA: hypothetical protein VFZ00_12750 [Solirubrobacter sp.]|nr:hypothetical protein [Solirubrobacter sp.]